MFTALVFSSVVVIICRMFLVYIVVICVAICVTETTKEELAQNWFDMHAVEDGHSDERKKVSDQRVSTGKTYTVDDNHKTRHGTLNSLKRKYKRRCVKRKETKSQKCKLLRADISDIRKKENKKKKNHTRRPNNQKSIPIEITKRKDPSLETKEKPLSVLENTFRDRCNNESKSSSFCVKLLKSITEKKIVEYAVKILHLPSTRDIGPMFLCSNHTPFSLLWYNPETEICCNGLYPRTSLSQQCCRGSVIDTETHFCCGMDEDSRIYSRDEYPQSDCCGAFFYKTDTEMCCNAKLYTAFENASCCDLDIYNPSTHICCDERAVHNRTSGDTCCGSDVYHTQSQMCCEGHLQQAYGEKNNRGRCCGNTSYDSSCYTCTNGSIIEPRFNITEQLCYNGQIERKRDNSSRICGQTVLNATGNVCINGSVVYISTTEKNNGSTLAIVNRKDDTLKRVHVETKEIERVVIVLIASSLTPIIAVGVTIAWLCHKHGYHLTSYSKSCSSEQSEHISTKHLQSEPRLRRYSKASLNVSLPLTTNNETTHPEDVSDDDDSERVSFIQAVDGNQAYNSAHVHYINKNSFAFDYFEKKWENSKPNNLHTGNLLTDHFIDRSTQTGPPKQCNRRTIFGRPFPHSYLLDFTNRSIHMPGSDVTMCLPITFLINNQVETHCSSFDSLPALRRKLNIPNDQSIASPVVEYALTGCTELPDYARVTLPFVGDPKQLTVWKFVSDEGLSTTAVSVKVPLKEKTNTDIDLYYAIEGRNAVVYTKSFSGFYCTTCKHTRELKLRTYLFGSYKRFQRARYEIRLMLYIADELLKFKDYSKRMYGIEHNEGRTIKVEQMLLLPTELREEDFLQASVTLSEDHETMWMHKLHPKTKRAIKPEEPKVFLRELVQKCPDCPNCHLQSTEIPYCVEWYLTSRPNVQPECTFQCVVDVQCVTERIPEVLLTKDNSLIIDELTLRPEDRIPFEESADAQRIRDIKEKIISWQYEKQVDIIRGLCSKYEVRGESVHEVFTHLQQKMTPSGIYEVVVAVLRSKHMFEELDDLKKSQILPDNYFPKPIQRVSEENKARGITTYTHRNIRYENENQTNTGHRNSHRQNRAESDAEEGATARLVDLDSINIDDENNKQRVQQDNVEVIYCRRERNESTPLTSLTQRNADYAELTPKSESGNVRRELTETIETYALNSIEEIPIQENASMDETSKKDLIDDCEYDS